jgi:hypothetical protein
MRKFLADLIQKIWPAKPQTPTENELLLYAIRRFESTTCMYIRELRYLHEHGRYEHERYEFSRNIHFSQPVRPKKPNLLTPTHVNWKQEGF